MLRRIYDRFHHDFLMKLKIKEYSSILESAVENNYEFHTVLSFEELIRNNQLSPNSNYLILRRDVDTKDLKMLRYFLNVEKRYGARCSYYFRLSTLDAKIIDEIIEQGGEAAYHYEEIASYCLKKRVKSKKEAVEALPVIRDQFLKNFRYLKENTKLQMQTVASHGDFVNVKLGLPNWHIVDDDIRKKTGILREAYDNEQMKYVTFRLADQTSVNYTNEAIQALRAKEKVVYLLTHPAQWRADIWVNLKMNIDRGVKGIYYKL